ncbi:uncharacterized protein LOC120414862 [Culex pipiens pallens]|uniref:uncharacterized protein LOC120414862 n=1 Tax=Culex pipiens pallens TaxID=42434 RepID=UPI00195329BF|nr:uncharacterized protein LOC120414862 [Culex pipiens pallens]
MRLVDWLEATEQYIQVNLELHNTFKADDLGKVFIQLKVVERRKQTRNTGNQAGAGPQEVPILLLDPFDQEIDQDPFALFQLVEQFSRAKVCTCETIPDQTVSEHLQITKHGR